MLRDRELASLPSRNRWRQTGETASCIGGPLTPAKDPQEHDNKRAKGLTLGQGQATSGPLAVYSLPEIIWCGFAKAAAGGTQNSMHLQQANFKVDDSVWPTNDAINSQMVPGRKKGLLVLPKETQTLDLASLFHRAETVGDRLPLTYASPLLDTHICTQEQKTHMDAHPTVTCGHG